MKNIVRSLSCALMVTLAGGSAMAVEVSSFCEAQVPGDYIIEAKEGDWNWGMAPIYDEDGKLHVFNSIIPKDGSWIKNSKISHYTADGPEGPYTFVGDVFVSEDASYHNPQISKVGDTYVLVFLLNKHKENGSKQEVGIATAKSLNGPWTESPLNPVIPASGKMGDYNIVHASNPTFVAAPDGKYRIYYKTMTDRYPVKKGFREISFAVSDQIEGPYVNYEGNPVISYIDQKVDIEDPYAFFYKGMYYMIVEDRQGVKDLLEGDPIPGAKLKKGGYRPGLIYQSKDGIHWGQPQVGYQTNEIYFGDKLARSERPHILWKDGEPECLFLACHDQDATAGYFVRIEGWQGEPKKSAQAAAAASSQLISLDAPAKQRQLEGSKPNIILVMTDDQGMGDLSCMGNQVVKTPNIDRFHDKATRFTDFHVSPTCAPTRAALMSGRAPFKNGVTHTIFQRERMALDTYTLPQALKSAGYATGIFGKWHLGDEEEYLPGNRGFDEVLIHGAGGIGQVSLGDFPPNGENVYFDNVLLHNDTIVQTKGFCTDLFFEAGLAWIKKQEEAKKPYFAYIALNAPHGPLVAPESNMKRFTELGWDKGTAGRYGMIENIDENFGRMMETLENWNALENTIVIYMTDNGATHLNGKRNGKKVKHFNANLKGGKNSPYEGGTHVPAFWQWKGVLGEGIDVDALTAHIDLYATLCELAGVTLPDKMQELDGRSLVPLLQNPNADWPERELFFHCGRWNPGKLDDSKFKKCAVRTKRWRFVNNETLYDISKDPSETTDVSASHPEVVEALRKAYDQWWKAVLPMMVNEGLPKLKQEQFPLNIRYHKQLKEQGIPDWAP